MRGIHHLITTTTIASIAYAYLAQPTTIIDGVMGIVALIAVAFGSIAPDIDIKGSMVRKWYVLLPTLPFWIAQFAVHVVLGKIYGFKHRGVMHSVIGWSASFGMIGALTDTMYGRTVSMVVCGGFAFGYLMHLIEDEVSTKTKIDWLPTPQFMKSWTFGVLLVLAVLMVIAPIVSAEDPVMGTKSFAEVEKAWDTLAYSVFWFGVKVALIYGGVMAYCGLQHKSVSIVKGLVIAFFIAFVLRGILVTIFT